MCYLDRVFIGVEFAWMLFLLYSDWLLEIRHAEGFHVHDFRVRRKRHILGCELHVSLRYVFFGKQEYKRSLFLRFCWILFQ